MSIDLSTLSFAELQALMAQARKEQEAQRDAARAQAQDAVELATQAVLEVQPASASTKEGSTWVGTVMGGFEVTVGDRKYAVQINVKDVAASNERKAAAKPA